MNPAAVVLALDLCALVSAAAVMVAIEARDLAYHGRHRAPRRGWLR